MQLTCKIKPKHLKLVNCINEYLAHVEPLNILINVHKTTKNKTFFYNSLYNLVNNLRSFIRNIITSLTFVSLK